MDDDLRPYRIKTTMFANGERCALIIDRQGLATFVGNDYGMLVLRERAGSSETMESSLRAICIALQWADAKGICLDERMGSLMLLTPQEVTGLRDEMRKDLRAGRNGVVSTEIVGPGHMKARCIAVRDYIAWRYRDVIGKVKVDDPRLIEARYRLDDFMTSMTADLGKQSDGTREGLDEETERFLIEVITPGHPLNPFQKRHQHRNEALILVYVDTSMRRAEALTLKGEDLRLDGQKPFVRIVRRPGDVDDTRRDEPHVKTQPRELSVTTRTAEKLRAWIVNIRADPKRYGRARRTAHVFVNRSGGPLAKRTVNDMFQLLRKRVPGLPGDLFTHILRHTGNDRFSKGSDIIGLSEEKERQARNYRMGWKKGSSQGEKYTQRRTREEAEKVIEAVQMKSVKRKA